MFGVLVELWWVVRDDKDGCIFDFRMLWEGWKEGYDVWEDFIVVRIYFGIYGLYGEEGCFDCLLWGGWLRECGEDEVVWFFEVYCGVEDVVVVFEGIVYLVLECMEFIVFLCGLLFVVGWEVEVRNDDGLEVGEDGENGWVSRILGEVFLMFERFGEGILEVKCDGYNIEVRVGGVFGDSLDEG